MLADFILFVFTYQLLSIFFKTEKRSHKRPAEGIEEEGYMLYFVDFDEQGQLIDLQQLQSIKTKLQQKHEEEKNFVIIVFIHGWNHSAKPDDDNLLLFKDALKKTKQFELEFPYGKEREREVVGVYLTWRGESLNFSKLSFLNTFFEVIKSFTFWSRKKVAEEIGRSGEITKTLLEL